MFQTSLNWESLPPDITNFTVSTGGFNFREFFIAISVEANDTNWQRVVSSGYVETDCIHDVKKGLVNGHRYFLQFYEAPLCLIDLLCIKVVRLVSLTNKGFHYAVGFIHCEPLNNMIYADFISCWQMS